MQEEKIKEKLNEYLKKNKDGKVISINGEWGVGKTFFWKEYIKNTSGYEYAYVSLYGKKNIDEITTDISIQLSDMQHLIEIAKNKLGGFKKITSFITMLESKNFDNVIICFDDFERLDKLTIESVLGLISNLKENKNCRIVMILNEKKIDSEKFSIGKEKIIDYEFLYNPQPNFSLSRTEVSNLKYFPIPYIEEYLKTYKINNIRVLKKMIKVLIDLELYLEEHKKVTFFDTLLIDILYDVLPYLYLYYNFNFKDFGKLFKYSQSQKFVDVTDESSIGGIEINQNFEHYINYFHKQKIIYENHFYTSLLYFFIHGYFDNSIKKSLKLRINVTVKKDKQKTFTKYFETLVYGINLDYKKSMEELSKFLTESQNYLGFLFSNLKYLRDKFLILKEINPQHEKLYEKIFENACINYLNYYKTNYPDNFFDYEFVSEISSIIEIKEHLLKIQQELSTQNLEYIKKMFNEILEESFYEQLEINEFQKSVLLNLTKQNIKDLFENTNIESIKSFFTFLERINNNYYVNREYHFLLLYTNEILDNISIDEHRLSYLKKKIQPNIKIDDTDNKF